MQLTLIEYIILYDKTESSLMYDFFCRFSQNGNKSAVNMRNNILVWYYDNGVHVSAGIISKTKHDSC